MTTERRAKPAKAITPAYLERIATFYLQRYAASQHKLRKVLERRVERNCRTRGEEPGEHAELISDIICRTMSSGLVDDRTYATAKVASLARRGASKSMIRMKLRHDGVEDGLVAEALSGHGHDDEQAARRLAQRRRLGPWRAKDRTERRDRDIAALCRAGFSPSLARAVIDGDHDQHSDAAEAMDDPDIC